MHLAFEVSLFKLRRNLYHAVKSYDMGPTAKEGVLRIFIALKNPSISPGLNPRTLVPVASTLAIAPPRLLSLMLLSVGLYFIRDKYRSLTI
jgi:hypothetical protein